MVERCPTPDLRATLEADLAGAERKAWDALARWKFWMFGYHAADVIKIKRRLGRGREPFFKDLVLFARKVMAERYGVAIACGDNYLIWSNYHGAWWKPDRAGYTPSLDQAGRYSREQAIEQCAHGRDGYTSRPHPPELPLREDVIVTRKAGSHIIDLVLPSDDAECRARDLARQPKVAA